MKKLINRPGDVVREALAGIALAHADDCACTQIPPTSCARTLPCAARSASSPAAAPATSRCTAASSAWACSTRPAPARCSPRPTPDQMLEATKAVDGGAGVLHIVKNYTGDVMNFEMAAELAEAEGIEVEQVVHRRRRRRPGQPLHRRAPRRRRHRAAREDRAARPPRKAGRSQRSPTSPQGQRQRPQHGDGADLLHRAGGRQADVRPRRRRDGGRRSASTASPAGSGCRSRRPRTSPTLLVATDPRRPAVRQGDSVIAFVNGMGGTPLIELYIMYNEVNQLLARPASRSHARSSATTSPRWRWPAAPSRCSRSTTSCLGSLGCTGQHARSAVGRVSMAIVR